jgi:NitT/TauT family transport system substrate-binding protein
MRRMTALLLAAASFALAAPTGRAAETVKVSAYQSVSDAGIYIALDRGYFTEAGLAVEITQLDTPPLVVTGLASGQVDVAGGAPSTAVYNAVRQGVPIRIVADKGSMPMGSGYIGLVLRKGLDATITTGAGLKGHPVAWTGIGLGTTNEVALDHFLKAAGLAERDMALQNLTFADSLSALGSGSVDAAYLIEPLMQAAVARGMGSIMQTGDEMYPNQQVAVLLYGPEFWSKRADAARRFMVAYLRGVRDYNNAFYRGQSRPAIVAILAKNTTVKQPDLYNRMVMPGLNPNGAVNLEGMRADMAWFAAHGYLKEPVDLNTAVDSSFAEAAVAKLGRYQ